MAALHSGRREALEISPNLWAGVGLVGEVIANDILPQRSQS